MITPSVLNGSETVTASYSPKTPWEVLVSVCKSENVSPEIILRPGDHREQTSVMLRTRVFRKLYEELSVKMIAEISGMSERRIYEMLGEKREKDLGLKEAYKAGNGRDTEGA